jgi:hypothetical protein
MDATPMKTYNEWLASMFSESERKALGDRFSILNLAKTWRRAAGSVTEES